MPNEWQHQQEATNAFWLKALCFCAFLFGRRMIRFLLFTIAFFYVIFAPKSREQSKQAFHRFTGKNADWQACFRNFLAFAQVSVDRLFFLAGKHQSITVNTHNTDIFNQERLAKGAILVVSHVGSFDVLRVLAETQQLKPIHILMDTQHNPEAFKLIQTLNPEMANNMIESHQPPSTLALTLQEKINQGHMIGIMADRLHHNETAVTVNFFDGKANLPTSPWLLASVLKVPVIFCIGILNSQLAYDLNFHVLTEKITAKRSDRQQALKGLVQSYATLLETYVRKTPDNWFNFYAFWHDE